MIKIIFLSLAFLFFIPMDSIGQDTSSTDEPEYLIDRSDLTQPLPKNSFQIQSGIAYSNSELDSSTLRQYAIPSIIARYAISDNFGIQAESELDLNENIFNGNVVDSNTEISYILIGFLYGIYPDKRILFFDQLSFVLDNSIPLNSSYNYYAELDMIFITNLSNPFSLEYGIGYGYENSNIGFHKSKDGLRSSSDGDGYLKFAFEFEGYLNRNIDYYISYNGNIIFGGDSQNYQNSVGIGFDFLTTSDYQFDISYTQGLNYSYSYINGVFVYTF